MKSCLLMVLGLLPLQDTPSPDELVRALDDDNIARREAAMMKLCDLGSAAIPSLLWAVEQPGEERQLRAQSALDRIERQIRIRAVFTDPPILDLRCQCRALQDLILTLGSKTGLSITMAGELGRRKVSITQAAMTPMEALDALCAAAGECDWSYVTPKVIEIREGALVSVPASYQSRFRFTLPHIETFRSRRGDRTTGTLCLCIQADHERGVSPIVPPEIVIEHVIDETGQDLVPALESPIRVNSLYRDDEMMGDPEFSFHSRPILLTGQQANARRLASVTGYAIYSFALQETTLDIPEVDSGAWIQQGELEFGVFGLRAGVLQVRIQQAQGLPIPRGILNVPGIRIIDDEGVEHQVPLHCVEMRDLSTGGVSSLHFLLSFDVLGQRQARKAKLRLVTECYEKRVSFSFTDVPLP
ncbi:MAG TPA: hypothetical protein VKU80_05915 [Planctomycetota bacterium]|nr:hypothetical protein [Planctomycetota bacterium]